MPTFCLDPVNGDDTKDGSQWTISGGAGPWKTFTSGATTARIAPGDTIKIAKSPDAVSIDAATWTNASASITLDTEKCGIVDLCEAAWTSDGGTNVTVGTSTTRIQGTYASSITVKAAFTTGLAAHHDITDHNYHDYQKLTFYIYASVAVSANYLKLSLCTNSDGTGAVDDFTIPISLSAGGHYTMTLARDGGGYISDNTISSIALTVITDLGGSDVTLILDDICAANDLHLQSVIGKNDGIWYPIKCFDTDTTLTLGAPNNSGTSVSVSYAGTSESTTTYARECLWLTGESTPTINDSGTSGSLITFEGGYNTSTDSKDGETFLFSRGFRSGNFVVSNKNYIKLKSMQMVYGSQFCDITTGSGHILEDVGQIGCYNGFCVNYGARKTEFKGTITSIQGYSNATMFSFAYGSSESFGDADWVVHMTGNVPAFQFNAVESLNFTGTVTIMHLNTTNGIAFRMLYTGGIYFRDVDISNGANIFSTMNSSGGVCNSLFTIDKLTLRDVGSYFIKYDATNAYNGPIRIGNCVIASGSFPSSNGWVSDESGEAWFAIDRYNADNRWLRKSSTGNMSDHITGGQASDWAYGGTGLSLLLNPGSTTRYLRYTFYVKVEDAVHKHLHMQVRKTSSSANCALMVTITGCGITPIDEESVTLTDSWAEYVSTGFTPDYNGFIAVDLLALDGSTTGDIGIDEIHLGD